MVSNLHAYAGIDEKWKVRLYVASRFLAYAWTPLCFSRVLYGTHLSPDTYQIHSLRVGCRNMMCKTDNLKRHIDYFSKGPKSNWTDRTQNRRSFQVNSILSFRHNVKHEIQHVGQLICIKGHII